MVTVHWLLEVLSCYMGSRFLGFTSQPSRHFTKDIDSPGEISVFEGSWAQKVNFFCVSPDFTRIRRTSSTGLGGFVFQAQNVFLMFFQTEFQDSVSPSQIRRIFSRSPISDSVNTKKVLVKFRPTVSSWTSTNMFVVSLWAPYNLT